MGFTAILSMKGNPVDSLTIGSDPIVLDGVSLDLSIAKGSKVLWNRLSFHFWIGHHTREVVSTSLRKC